MPRYLTADPDDHATQITVLDEAGIYQIDTVLPGNTHSTVIRFQDGTIPDVGANGVTVEAVLAVAADRLRVFQRTPLSCRENALALTKIEEALHWLHHRTRDRRLRGVEGTTEA